MDEVFNLLQLLTFHKFVNEKDLSNKLHNTFILDLQQHLHYLHPRIIWTCISEYCQNPLSFAQIPFRLLSGFHTFLFVLCLKKKEKLSKYKHLLPSILVTFK